MQIYVIAVGEKAPDWVESGVNAYLTRMPRECKVRMITVATTKRTKNISVTQAQELEQNQLIKNTPNNAYRVALDEKGATYTTTEFASKLKYWLQNTSTVTLYIGGPDGFTTEFLSNVDLVLSISALTMPHMLVRLVLVEQLYRAWTIINRHPYHRE